MKHTEYSPIQPISFMRESHKIETDTILLEELASLESISGISMRNFTVAASHLVSDVGNFIDGVISGVARFTNHDMLSVSRETYQKLEIDDNFLLFIKSSLNEPMDALERIHHTVSGIHGEMGFGQMGKVGNLFLNAFEGVLASDMYSRLEKSVRGHNENLGLGVRDMYLLLASDVIDEINDIYPSQNETGTGCLPKSLWSPIGIGSRHDLKSGFHFGTGIGMTISAFGYTRKMLQWFFGKSPDVNKLKKNPSKPFYKLKSKEALPFYVKKKGIDIPLSSIEGSFKLRNIDCYPSRYSYISISDSVVFIEVNRLFKDFYLNRNIFEHRVNEFLTDIAILVATYTMFIRQANLIGDLSDSETELKACLERLCLGAEILKSVSHDKDILKILGLSKFDHDKSRGNKEDLMGCIREAAENCESIALTILSHQDIWDILPMIDDNAVILETGKSDVLDTLEKLNTILYFLDELKDISSVLDIQHISFTLKQFQYKLKLAGV
jgi:hypothetical protein